MMQEVFDTHSARVAHRIDTLRAYHHFMLTLRISVVERRKDLVHPGLREAVSRKFGHVLPTLSVLDIEALPEEMQVRWTGTLPSGHILALACLPRSQLVRASTLHMAYGPLANAYLLFGNPLYYLDEGFHLPDDDVANLARAALNVYWESQGFEKLPPHRERF